MQNFPALYRFAGTIRRMGRLRLQSSPDSFAIYPLTCRVERDRARSPATWLTLVPLTAFFMGLFWYSAGSEDKIGRLAAAFSFYGALYSGIPLLVGIPLYGPSSLQTATRILRSVRESLYLALRRLMAALGYLARPVAFAIGYSISFARFLLSITAWLVSGLLLPFRLAIKIVMVVTRHLSRAFSAALRIVNRILARTESPVRGGFSLIVRLAEAAANSWPSVFDRFRLASEYAAAAVYSFTAPVVRVLGSIGRISTKVAAVCVGFVHGLISSLLMLIISVISFSARVIRRGAMRSASVIRQMLTGIRLMIASSIAVIGPPAGRLVREAKRRVRGPSLQLARAIADAGRRAVTVLGLSLERCAALARPRVTQVLLASASVIRRLLAIIFAATQWAIPVTAGLSKRAFLAIACAIKRTACFLGALLVRVISTALTPLFLVLRFLASLIGVVFQAARTVISGSFSVLIGSTRPITRAAASAIKRASLALGFLTAATLAGIRDMCVRMLALLTPWMRAVFSLLGRLLAGGVSMLRRFSLQVLRAEAAAVHAAVALVAVLSARLVNIARPFGRNVSDAALRLYRRLGPAASMVIAASCLLVIAAACAAAPVPSLRIIAGSGFSSFESILTKFGTDNHASIKVDYLGSLDIAQRLEAGTLDYDAIWDGDTMWTSISDPRKVIKHRESTMLSPIVLGLKRPIAEKLGWIGKNVSMEEILTAAEGEKLRIMMTSATQSNSGTFAYLGFLYAFAKPADVLTSADLQNADVRASVKQLLAQIDRTSDSSGWLRDLFEKEYDKHDAMFNYESHIIELNQRLAKAGKAPLYIVYPNPGLGIADFPFSYVDRGDPEKEKLFLALQKYLLSGVVQSQFAAKGRRIGACATPGQVNLAVFNPDFGVDINRGCTPLRLPSAPVILEALNLYQTVLRKPSFTAFLLDFSGSMASLPGQSGGEAQLKAAMDTLLDQQKVAPYYLQWSPDDITLVIPFNHGLLDEWYVEGNDAGALLALDKKVAARSTGGSTDIYLPTVRALEVMKSKGLGDRLPSIILMTDGMSNTGLGIEDVKKAIAETGLDNVPINAITFGDADPTQLQALADLTGGRVFDGKQDLLAAFRKAKGNN